MNATSRAICETVLTSDVNLSVAERAALRRVLEGEFGESVGISEPLLVTQKEAAQRLRLSRVTLWRLTQQGTFHPVEVTPGTWRYRWEEVAAFARNGCRMRESKGRRLARAQTTA
jgi:predicted DNA-binding transcriptional regulator AlpA